MWRGVSDAKSRASVRTRHSLRLIYCYISRRDAKYRMSINSFSDYKHLLQENFTLHLRRVSAVDNFPTRRRTSTLGFTCSSVFGCNISKQVDLGKMVRYPGHHDHWISPALDFFLCHVFIVTFVTFGFWMQHFQTGGLGEMVRQPGHHDHRISHPFTSFYIMCLL